MNEYPKSCGCAGPKYLSQCAPHKLETLAEHAQRLGMDRIHIESPSAVCGLIGCKRSELHEHVVLADSGGDRVAQTSGGAGS